jgi:hypothetical protein
MRQPSGFRVVDLTSGKDLSSPDETESFFICMLAFWAAGHLGYCRFLIILPSRFWGPVAERYPRRYARPGGKPMGERRIASL